jgi:MscS family membrane protein
MIKTFFSFAWVRNLLIPVVLFLMFLALSKSITGLLFRLIAKASAKTGGTWGEKLSRSFRKPLRVTLIVIGLYVALTACPVVWSNAAASAALTKCFRSFLILAVTWGFYRMADRVELGGSSFAKKLDLQVDEALLPVISGALRFVLVALAVLIVAQEWNFSISGLIAGLGLGGLAFALAAKDMLANLFGGLVILLDRSFAIGDWIKTGGVEGTVEDLNFRCIRLRTAEQSVVTIPNSLVASAPVENYSRMGKRRVEFTLTVAAREPDHIRKCVERINGLLAESSDVEQGTFSAVLSGIGASGSVLSIYYHTCMAEYGEYLRVRERIYYAILAILQDEGVSLAV